MRQLGLQARVDCLRSLLLGMPNRVQALQSLASLQTCLQTICERFLAMKILLCNDDGYQAQGIEALYAALRCVADVQVIAPEFNNSAKSNALTLHAPLYVQQAGNGSY